MVKSYLQLCETIYGLKVEFQNSVFHSKDVNSDKAHREIVDFDKLFFYSKTLVFYQNVLEKLYCSSFFGYFIYK